MEALIASAEDRTFTTVVDEDERLRTGCIGDGDQARVYPGAFELLTVENGSVVVPTSGRR